VGFWRHELAAGDSFLPIDPKMPISILSGISKEIGGFQRRRRRTKGMGFRVARREWHGIISEEVAELVEQIDATTELAFAAFLLGLAYWEWVYESPV
jgi:hypothetical protein